MFTIESDLEEPVLRVLVWELAGFPEVLVLQPQAPVQDQVPKVEVREVLE